MAEPDWFSVDEAAQALMAYDQGADVDPNVWSQDTPEAERQDYRREAARIAIVLDILRKKDQA